MPLQKAKSAKKEDVKKAISSNISELKHHGKKQRSQKQIIAIALASAKKK